MVTSTAPVATCSWTWRSPTPTCFSDLPSTRLTSHVQIAPSLCLHIGQLFASCPFIINDISCFSVFLPRSKIGKNIHRCARRWSCWNTSDIWAKCQRLGSAFYMSKMSQTSFLSDVKFSEWKTWASKLWFQLKTHCNDGQIEGYSSYHSHSAVKRKSNWATQKVFANGRWAGQKKDQKLSHR